MSSREVFLAQEDDGLPLEDEELVGVLTLKIVGKIDEVAVTVLAKVLGAQIWQLILALDVVDAGFALRHQLLHEKISQCDMLCATSVGTVANDVQHRCVVNIQRHAAEALTEAQLQYHIGAERRLLHFQSCLHELRLYCELCALPLQFHHEDGRSVGQRHDV